MRARSTVPKFRRFGHPVWRLNSAVLYQTGTGTYTVNPDGIRTATLQVSTVGVIPRRPMTETSSS